MFGQAQRFAAGYDIPNNIPYATFYSTDGKTKQINIRDDGIWCYTFDGGNSRKLWETALKSDLNSIIISKTYENVVSDNVGQKVLPDVPSGYRIISAVTEHYRYGCFISGNHSIRFYVITNTDSPVQATNETIGKLTVTFAKNL